MTDRTPQQTASLRRLREVIEAAPEHLLHMRAYKEAADCGTAYCALGWAAQDPQLRAQLEEVLGKERCVEVFFETELAAQEVFGLSPRDARFLFASGILKCTPPHAVSKAEVLWNIDELLHGRDARPYAAVPNT